MKLKENLLKPSLSIVAISFVLFLILPTYMETACPTYGQSDDKDPKQQESCYHYFVTVGSYIGSREINWIARNHSASLVKVIVVV